MISADSAYALRDILTQLPCDEISFWLDGHYSGGITGQGETETPIKKELETIGEHIKACRRLRECVVFVDDMRFLSPNKAEYAAYPPLDYLVDWARSIGAKWHIEHDIFVARITHFTPTRDY